MRVAVVGAGIAGTSAARFLAERGHLVSVFEQFEPGHARGSSHGNSRIVRKAYPDAFYTEIMLEAYPMWAELQAASEIPILHECGLFYFGGADDPNMRAVVSGLGALGVPSLTLDANQAAKLFPHFRLARDEIGSFSHEAGWVHAANAVLATRRLAEAAGATFRQRRIEALGELEKSFDRIVLCPGAWMRRFLDLDVRVTVQSYSYLNARFGGPVWIEEGPNYAYGFPAEPGRASVKLGAHNIRIPFEPDSERDEREIVSRTADGVLDFARRRLAAPNPQIVESATCLYTLTPNEDFRIGRADERVFFASACSGHGFKFGPWIGGYLADLVEERCAPSRFGRFDASPARIG